MKGFIIAILACWTIAGALDGLTETLTWHYNAFQIRFPDACAEYWNPAKSWVNKYSSLEPLTPRFFGATTFLSWTTDAYHFFRFITSIFYATGWILCAYFFAIRVKQFTIFDALWIAVPFWSAKAAGFYVIYNLLF